MRMLQTADGRNLRRVTFERLKELATYVLEHRENDTKSMNEILVCLRILLIGKCFDAAKRRGAQFSRVFSSRH